MFYLTKKNAFTLLLGSSFLATGGGPPYDVQRKMYKNLFAKKTKIQVREAKEFPPSIHLVTSYGVGDASGIHITPPLVRSAFREYEQLTKISIRGVIPGELGAEILALQTASAMKLSVVDSDLVGGRSAPEIQIDVFSVYGLPLTPLLGASVNKKSLFFSGRFSPREIEGILRNFFKENGGDGLLIGYPIRAGIYRKVGIQGTLSRAMKIGAYLAKKDLGGLAEQFQMKIIGVERIQKVNLESREGFLKGWVTLERSKIWVKNEHIALWQGSKKIVGAPDGIALLDRSYAPIHNGKIQEYRGKKVTIVVFKALGYWKNQKNQKLWLGAFR